MGTPTSSSIVLAIRPRLLCDVLFSALSLSPYTKSVICCADLDKYPAGVDWSQARWLITTPLNNGKLSNPSSGLLEKYPSLSILLLSADSRYIEIYFMNENGCLHCREQQDISLQVLCSILENKN